MKQIDEKNNRIPGKKAVLAIMMLAGVLLCSSASASSKAATIQVSCTIKPMIEMSASSSIRATSNLDKKYQMTENELERGLQKIKLYSLTAL